jgi:proteic killer suppression protein
MRLAFRNPALQKLETEDDPAYSESVTERFRNRVNLIRSALDERDFRALKSLHLEKLKGNRSHQRSMRLNDQFRLILEYEGEAPNKTVVIVDIEDYH